MSRKKPIENTIDKVAFLNCGIVSPDRHLSTLSISFSDVFSKTAAKTKGMARIQTKAHHGESGKDRTYNRSIANNKATSGKYVMYQAST